MIAACYTVDLYCENAERRESENCPTGWEAHTYTGQTWGQCARQARKDGWVISRDRTRAYCPACSKKKARNVRAAETPASPASDG